ncbi:MAG: hypothetical protein AMXMBFR55_16530 [Gemmatimonadota bacterium]
MHGKSIFALPLLWLAACGGGAEKGAPATAESAPSEPPVVTIVAKDFAFEAPDTIHAGMTTLKLVNEGPNLHHVQLVRLREGRSYEEFLAALKEMKPGMAPPAWIIDVAGPNSPLPGGESSLTQELQPGTYALTCFIDTPDHVPHIAKGMVKPLTILPNNMPSAAAPTADITVTMSDYAWEITPALSAGKHVIRIENAASQPHEMFIMQLAPGKTAEDVMKWGQTYEGPPPGKPMGGISGMATGQVGYLPVDLPAGEYLLVCFLPDAKDGQPHLAHGMIKQLTVS